MRWNPAESSEDFYKKQNDCNERFNTVTTNTLSRKIDALDRKIDKLIKSFEEQSND